MAVWKLDRWGRSVVQSIQRIEELASMGIRFLAVTQNIETGDENPMARFLLNIFAAFAEFEREMIDPGARRVWPYECQSKGQEARASEANLPAR